MFDTEIAEIKKLLKPGRRRQVEALARLRPLAILNATIQGEKGQPSDADLRRIAAEVSSGGKAWGDVFRGAAAVEIAADGAGPSISLRLTKKEGIPIQLVAEGTPGASVVAVKRVDELSFYSLGAQELAEKLDLTMPKVVAIVDHLGLRGRTNCYKEIKIGKAVFKRYSPLAIDAIKAALETENAEDIWRKHKGKG